MAQAPSRLLIRATTPALMAATLFAATAHAQTLTRVVPEAADPGDLVRFEGTGLGATETVVFTANVGGLVGVDDIEVAPISVSDQLVFAFVPQFGTFAKSTSVPPPAFVGNVGLVAEGAALGSRPFGYYEVAKGAVSTFGQGGSEAGAAPPQFAVGLGGGLPEPGETFRPKVVDAAPNQIASLRLGFPAPEPYQSFWGGLYLLDPGGPAKPVAFGFVKEDGTLTAPPVTVPSEAVGLEVAYQWWLLTPFSQGKSSVSNGLRVRLDGL